MVLVCVRFAVCSTLDLGQQVQQVIRSRDLHCSLSGSVVDVRSNQCNFMAKPLVDQATAVPSDLLINSQGYREQTRF